MHLTLFKALRSLKSSDEIGTAVADQIQEHIAVKISEATKGLETKLDVKTQALEAKIDATAKGLEAQLRALTWLIGSYGIIVSLMGVMAVVATFGPPIQKMLGR